MVVQMGTGMPDRVAAIFSSVLKIPPETITDETSPDNTSQWDSLAVIDLVLAIEDEFQVKFTTKEIVAMRNVSLVKKMLRSKGALHA